MIEGGIVPGLRDEEGPLGEFMDGHVEVGRNHVLRARAITRRADAICHVMLGGGTVDLSLRSLALRSEVWKRNHPTLRVRAIGMPAPLRSADRSQTRDERLLGRVFDADLSDAAEKLR